MAAKKKQTAPAKRAAVKKTIAKKAGRTVASRRAAAKGSSASANKPKASGKPRAASPAARAKSVTKKVTPEPLAAAVEALAAGAAAPAFERLDHSGKALSSRELAGKPYVLYFYPKDDTPGCTTEACNFRDSLEAFEKAGVRVLGVSPDSSQSHQKFRDKYALPFSLLSDPDQTLASAYGVWAKKKNYGREYMGVVRSTFLVGADGKLKRTWRGVRVPGHVDEVLAAANELS